MCSGCKSSGITAGLQLISVRCVAGQLCGCCIENAWLLLVQTVICNNDNSSCLKRTISFHLHGNNILPTVLSTREPCRNTLALLWRGGGAGGWRAGRPRRGRHPPPRSSSEADEGTRRSMKLPSWLSFCGPKKSWGSRSAVLLAVKRSHSGWREVEEEGMVGAGGMNRKKSFRRSFAHSWSGNNFAGVAVSLAVTAVEFDPINL